ncbi:MAG: Prephenate dehydratase [Methanocella sp. PtaU1.Bin125]|nr:MAG: Prephenate dehydratase [Methanocella sp. PtaU1.Bin125]
MMKLGLLGPEGTFSEIAARKWNDKAELVFLDDNELVARAVDDGVCDEAIVPIENSVEGPVGVVHDQLLKNKSPIVGEVIVPIRQCLLSRGQPSEIKVILSHPQALGQCRKYLREHYPKAELRPTGSTTHAAKLAQEFNEMAAVGSVAAAERYGLNIIARGIQDTEANYTRFIVIGKKVPAPTGNDKTSMAVYLDRDRPGALYEFLGEFARRQINMTRIESRPSRLTLGDYWFFIDVEGHLEDGPVKEAIVSLEKMVPELKVLGSYPRAKLT